MPSTLLDFWKLPAAYHARALACHDDARTCDLLFETYTAREGGHSLRVAARQAYYTARPVLPRPLQIALRQQAAGWMGRRTFPAWPVDMTVELRHQLALLDAFPHQPVPHLSFWPDGAQTCLVLTHDIEGTAGFAQIECLAEIERRWDFRSSFNFVPERYPIDWSVLRALQADGFEIGVHGLHHDGRLFSSQAEFARRAARINVYLQDWGSAGFRSPSNLRRLDWIAAHITAEYDSSSPSSEHYGAQPGGCCTVFPFFADELVELPITLPQDHTLLEILSLSPEELLAYWLETARTIQAANGLVLLIAHPDYLLAPARLQAYERFLATMRETPGVWAALPMDVARWWRDRRASELVWDGNSWQVHGPAAGRATLAWYPLQSSFPLSY